LSQGSNAKLTSVKLIYTCTQGSSQLQGVMYTHQQFRGDLANTKIPTCRRTRPSRQRRDTEEWAVSIHAREFRPAENNAWRPPPTTDPTSSYRVTRHTNRPNRERCLPRGNRRVKLPYLRRSCYNGILPL